MEVSVMGNSQAKIVRADFAFSEIGFCKSFKNTDKNCKIFGPKNNSIYFGHNTTKYWERARSHFASKAVKVEAVLSDNIVQPKSCDGARLFVGLPLDAVSDSGTVNHPRAIAAGLKALKLLGVEGVELPVWWGIAEKEAMGKFEWDGYLAIAEMVQKAGLKLHVSLCFHASEQPQISLPEWVTKIGESQPDIFYADRSGQHYKECLSLSVDKLPVLDGLTPIEAYRKFCESFKMTFSPFMDSTIMGISVGLGPDGELRYPSHPRLAKDSRVPGVGEFQCYDKHMLNLLKQHAEENGNPLWGLGGPHDACGCDQSPQSNNFFKDHGGSWETSYGDFFLSWYSKQLMSHGNHMLCIASSTFKDTPVDIYGKLPLVHFWYNTRSHPSELTAGYYSTQTRDGYDAVAELFAKNSVRMILPGMDLSDKCQPAESHSSPESLLTHISSACRKHGVEVHGQNSSASGFPGGFENIKKNLLNENVMNLFTYQRMGAHFFSPEHFPSFTEFVRSLSHPILHSDDLPDEHAAAIESPVMQMQMA